MRLSLSLLLSVLSQGVATLPVGRDVICVDEHGTFTTTGRLPVEGLPSLECLFSLAAADASDAVTVQFLAVPRPADPTEWQHIRRRSTDFMPVKMAAKMAGMSEMLLAFMTGALAALLLVLFAFTLQLSPAVCLQGTCT